MSNLSMIIDDFDEAINLKSTWLLRWLNAWMKAIKVLGILDVHVA